MYVHMYVLYNTLPSSMVEIGCISQVCRSAGAFNYCYYYYYYFAQRSQSRNKLLLLRFERGLGMCCDIFLNELSKKDFATFEGFNTLLFLLFFFSIYLLNFFLIFFYFFFRILKALFWNQTKSGGMYI